MSYISHLTLHFSDFYDSLSHIGRKIMDEIKKSDKGADYWSDYHTRQTGNADRSLAWSIYGIYSHYDHRDSVSLRDFVAMVQSYM